MIKNIIFSTTRQWNPGDEIILKGIINILESLKIEINPLIFNRNPDIRSFFGNYQCREKAKVENECWHHIKSAMMDNSVKPWMEYTNIDAIIFAGTPEWQGWRSRELYINAIKYHLPVYLIGIDTVYIGDDFVITSVINKAKFISIRNKKIESSFIEKGIRPYYLPCPSIFAYNTEKRISKVQCIGLIYRGINESVTFGNGWEKENYQLQNEFFQQVIQKYKNQCEIIIICHYVDELYFAQKDFPDEEIKYSYDSADYIEIYRKCDLVIGSRIHGIGIATAIGIPSIPIKYDGRQGTIDGFYPDSMLFKNLNGIDSVDRCFTHIKEMNQELISHKKAALIMYQKLLKNKLNFEKVVYDYTLISIPKKYYVKEYQKLCKLDEYINNQMVRNFIKIVINHINYIIEGKRIVIKGAGLHTKKLLGYLTDNVEIVCIVDNCKKFFEGYHVIQNNEIHQIDFDYIMISSYYFEREMIKEMEELELLDKILPFYRIFEDNFGKIEHAFFEYLENENAEYICNFERKETSR